MGRRDARSDCLAALTRAPSLTQPRLRHGLALYLSFLFAYGLGNAVQDFQLEQLVKRGVMTYQLPMVLAPSLSWAWAVLLAVAAAIYLLALRPLARGAPKQPERATIESPALLLHPH